MIPDRVKEVEMPEGEFKHIVRIAGKDLTGMKPVYRALSELKGVDFTFARAVAFAAEVNPFTKLGDLKDEQIARIERVLKSPLEHEIPFWMLNRRKDFESGEDIHLIGHTIDLTVRADIGRERRIRSRRGIRHELGLPVRGQRTRTTGRRGLSVGVKRKEVRIAEATRKKEKKE
jgi:small subunit ribosomal protein S13